MVYGNVKTIIKIIWTHFYSAFGTRIRHRRTGFNIIYRWFLKYWQVNVGCHKTDACLRHALDLHPIIYNSAVQLQFSLIGLCMSTSALNQQFWRQFLGIQLDTSIAIAILRKHFHIICSTRIGQWRKGKLRPTGFLKSHFLAASTGMKFFNSAYFLCVCLERMSTNQE